MYPSDLRDRHWFALEPLLNFEQSSFSHPVLGGTVMTNRGLVEDGKIAFFC